MSHEQESYAISSEQEKMALLVQMIKCCDENANGKVTEDGAILLTSRWLIVAKCAEIGGQVISCWNPRRLSLADADEVVNIFVESLGEDKTLSTRAELHYLNFFTKNKSFVENCMFEVGRRVKEDKIISHVSSHMRCTKSPRV